MSRSAARTRAVGPRFERLEPRILLSADLPIAPLIEPHDLGTFLYERSLLSESLDNGAKDSSVIDRIRSVSIGVSGRMPIHESSSRADRASRYESASGSARGLGTERSLGIGRASDSLAASISDAYSAFRAIALAGAVQDSGSQRAELTVSNLSIDGDPSVDETVALSWTVANEGASETPDSGWHDVVYFSSDARYDERDLRLGFVYTHAEDALDVGESSERTLSLDLPTHRDEGYLIVATDRFDHIPEFDNEDNYQAISVVLNQTTPTDDASESVGLPGSGSRGITPVDTVAVNQLLTGLDSLSEWAANLDSFGAIGQALPLMTFFNEAAGGAEAIAESISLTSALGVSSPAFDGLQASLETQLLEPLRAFLANPDQTVESIVSEIESQASISNVTGVIETVQDVEELKFTLEFSDTQTLGQIQLDLEGAADEIGLSVNSDAMLQLQSTLSFGFTFGVTLGAGGGDPFFIESTDGLTIQAALVSNEGLNFTGSLGFLDVGFSGASFMLTGNISAEFKELTEGVTRRVTGSELSTASFDDLVELSVMPAPYTLTLPISATLDGLGGSATVTITGDAYSEMPPDVMFDEAEFDPFGAFINTDAFTFAGLVEQLGSWFTDFGATELLSTELPFTEVSLGDVLDLGLPFRELVDELVGSEPEGGNEPTFNSVQELNEVLLSILGADGEGSEPNVSVSYDSDEKEIILDLQFSVGSLETDDFRFAETFINDVLIQDLAFDYDLPAELGGLSSSATLTLGLSSAFAIKLGVKLEELGAGKDPYTSDSLLSEVFRSIGDDVQGIRINPGVNDLAVRTRDGVEHAPINLDGVTTIGGVLTALSAIPNVTAELSDDGFSIIVTDASTPALDPNGEPLSRFRIGRPNGADGMPLDSFAASDLGLSQQDLDNDGVIEGLSLHGDSYLERFFIRDAAITPRVTIDATDVTANAAFGFLELGLGEGATPGAISVDLEAVIPFGNTQAEEGRMNTILLSELFEAIINSTSSDEPDPTPLAEPIDSSEASPDVASANGMEEELTLLDLVRRPTFAGTASATLPVTSVLGDSFGELPLDLPTIQVDFTLPPIGEIPDIPVDELSLPTIDIDGLLVSDLFSGFENIDIGDILNGLETALDILDQFEEFEFLRADLPLIEISVRDILGIAQDFNAFVESFTSTDINTPDPPLLSDLQTRLNAGLDEIFSFADPDAVDVVVSVDRSALTSALKFEFTIADTFSGELPLSIDLVDLLSEAVPDLPEQVGDLVSAGASGSIAIEAGYDLSLDFGIDLGDPAAPFLYDTTGFTADLSILAEDIDASVSLGPLPASISGGFAGIGAVTGSFDDSGDPAAYAPIELGFGILDDPSDGRVTFSEFFDAPSTYFGLETPPVVGVLVDLPVSAAGIDLGSIGLAIDDLLADDPQITGVFPGDEFLDAFANLDLVGQLELLINGVDFTLSGLSETINSDFLRLNLPIVGEQLEGAATFFETIRQNTTAPLIRAIDEAPSDDRDAAVQAVADALTSVLGEGPFDVYDENGMVVDSLPGLNFLRDTDGDPITPPAVTFELLNEMNMPAGMGEAVTSIVFDIPLGKEIPLASIPFDLALPALDLDIDATVGLTLAFGWDLRLGVSLDDGFFLDVSASPSPATEPAIVSVSDNGELLPPAAEPAMDGRAAELFIELRADADPPAAPDDPTDDSVDGLSVEGTLAILSVMASSLETTGADEFDTSLTALFGFDIIDPGTGDAQDGHLTYNEFVAARTKDLLNPLVTVDAQVDLSLQAMVNIPDVEAIFPSIMTDLRFAGGLFIPLDMGFDADAIEYSITRLELNNVSIDPGALFTDFILPIAQEIDGALEPFYDLRNTILEPVPVISELRGNDTSLRDLAVELGSAFGINLSWIDAVIDIIDLVEFLANLQVPADGSGIMFGSINLTDFFSDTGGSGGSKDADLSQLDLSTYDGTDESGMSAMDQAMNSMGVGSALSQSSNIRGGGFEFPLLSDPFSAMGLLLGQDADLFIYNMASLDFSFYFSSFFALAGPLGVRISGSFSAEVNLGFGYDTTGIRKAVQLIEGGAPAGDIAFAIVDGFFLVDKVDGVERVEGRLTGSLTAGLEINAVIARAGVSGGLFATFEADLNDLNDDGKVRISEVIEIVDQTGNFFCLFDFSGNLTASLYAYLEINLLVTSITYDYEIGSETLLEFSFNCVLNEPVLASVNNGTLLLHMGPNAHLREFGLTSDSVEEFTVTELSAGQMRVEAFGLSQVYNGVQQIYAEGGGLNDVIRTFVSVPTELYGGYNGAPGPIADGADQLEGGSGVNVIHGGQGNDSITAANSASANNTFYGDEGRDTITVLDGVSLIFGGLDRDTITGGAGVDVIHGGGDRDTIVGRGGDDTIYGDEGNDTIAGGDGNDYIEGGENDDDITGGLGSDTILGGLGRDVVDGIDIARGVMADTSSRDIIIGGDDQDTITAISTGLVGVLGNIVVGGGASDVIITGDGHDLIFGDTDDSSEGGADDTIDSGGGNDQILGGSGFDEINSGDGDDIVFADYTFELETIEAAALGVQNLIRAGAGNDIVFGSINVDNVFGGIGDDSIYGGFGNDILRGEQGEDLILGGAGDDEIFGGADADMLFGEGGTDEIFGEGGSDVIVAGTGLGDQLFGGLGDDEIYGSDDAPAAPRGSGGGPRGDYVEGGDGNDTIYTYAGDDRVFGGMGQDFIHTGLGADDIMTGGDGDFVFGGIGEANTITGGSGDDLIYGSDDARDIIRGGGGVDMIFGQGGDDIIYGDGGDDIIDGGAGFDEIRGGDGDDVINGGGWSDLIFGDAGNDFITGSDDGDDEIYGGTGDDMIYSLGSNDIIEAGDGEDTVDAGRGDDLVYGDAGNDTLAGGADHDVIYGFRDPGSGDDAGQDTIYGDAMGGGESESDGRDRLFGGAGTDYIFGQGEDDFIDPGPGAADFYDYGSGERPIEEDFIQPDPTPSEAFGTRPPSMFEEVVAPPPPTVEVPALPTIPEFEPPQPRAQPPIDPFFVARRTL